MSEQYSYKYYEGKIPNKVGNETRSEQIERKNYHSKMAGLIKVARERHSRRHGKGRKTPRSEALERAKLYSKER